MELAYRTSISHFFENLNVLDIKDITHAKGVFSSYVIQSTGERII